MRMAPPHPAARRIEPRYSLRHHACYLLFSVHIDQHGRGMRVPKIASLPTCRSGFQIKPRDRVALTSNHDDHRVPVEERRIPVSPQHHVSTHLPDQSSSPNHLARLTSSALKLAG